MLILLGSLKKNIMFPTPKKIGPNIGASNRPNAGASEEEAQAIAGLHEVGELQAKVPGLERGVPGGV